MDRLRNHRHSKLARLATTANDLPEKRRELTLADDAGVAQLAEQPLCNQSRNAYRVGRDGVDENPETRHSNA